MDGNYKTVYPPKKDPKKWEDEDKQKRAEEFQKGFTKGPGLFQKLKEWIKKKESK